MNKLGRHIIGISAATVLTGLSVHSALAADVISIRYDISFGGARVMKADYSATLGDGNYAASLEAKTVGVSKMFSKIKLNLAANGSLSDSGIKPQSYSYFRKKNDKRKERNLNFAPNGSLVMDKDYDATIKSALNNKVMDPLSTLLKLTRAEKPCSGKHRAFDGRDVFDITLSGGNKNGKTITCKMIYTPVAGSDVEDGDTAPTTYEITLAPLASNGVFVPVLFTGSTKGVSFEAAAASVSLNGEAVTY